MKWIATKDSLPADGERVLFVRMGHVEEGIYDLNAPVNGKTRYRMEGPRFVGDRNYGAGDAFDSVTHWMPFPVFDPTDL